jgi:hypothetical protein
MQVLDVGYREVMVLLSLPLGRRYQDVKVSFVQLDMLSVPSS